MKKQSPKRSNRCFVAKLKCTANGSTLQSKVVPESQLKTLLKKQKEDPSNIYFGFDGVREYSYDTKKTMKTLFLFAASPPQINRNCTTALHVQHPHLACKPLRVFIRPRRDIAVEVWSKDNTNGKMYQTIKRWKWNNLSADPFKGFAVAVFRKSTGPIIGGSEEYRFKIHCHGASGSGSNKMKNDPIRIGNPSHLKPIKREAMKVGIPEYAPNGKIRFRFVKLKSIAIRPSSTMSAVA